jgi:hypothetical protein
MCPRARTSGTSAPAATGGRHDFIALHFSFAPQNRHICLSLGLAACQQGASFGFDDNLKAPKLNTHAQFGVSSETGYRFHFR